MFVIMWHIFQYNDDDDGKKFYCMSFNILKIMSLVEFLMKI